MHAETTDAPAAPPLEMGAREPVLSRALLSLLSGSGSAYPRPRSDPGLECLVSCER